MRLKLETTIIRIAGTGFASERNPSKLVNFVRCFGKEKFLEKVWIPSLGLSRERKTGSGVESEQGSKQGSKSI